MMMMMMMSWQYVRYEWMLKRRTCNVVKILDPIPILIYSHQLIAQNSNCPDAGYPEQLGSSGKFIQNSKKLTCLEITGYQIKYSTVQCYGFWTLNQAWSKGSDAGTQSKQ